MPTAKEERAVRFKVAIEIIDRIYTDMCHDPEVPKEDVEQFCDLMHKLIHMGAELGCYPKS